MIKVSDIIKARARNGPAHRSNRDIAQACPHLPDHEFMGPILAPTTPSPSYSPHSTTAFDPGPAADK